MTRWATGSSCTTRAQRTELHGLAVVITRLDGGVSERVVVRQSVQVPAEDYIVLGRPAPGDDASHIAYDFTWDFDRTLYDAVVFEVEACGEVVDTALVRRLPARGSWSLDGASVPDAERNDDESGWCVDDTPGPDPEAGLPGTPGRQNVACE